MISKLIEGTLDLFNFKFILIFYSVLFDNYHRLFYLFVEEHAVDRSKEFGKKYIWMESYCIADEGCGD